MKKLFAPAALLLALSPLGAGSAAGGVGPDLKIRAAEHLRDATSTMMLAAARAGNRLVAVGDHGVVLLSDDGGAHFRQAKSVAARATLTSVCFVDEKTGWAAGHWGVILATTDGGETWSLQRSDTSTDQPLFSVYFRNANEGWAVGLWSLVVATRNGGRTWETVQLPPPPEGGKTDRNLFRVFGGPKGSIVVAAEQGTVLHSSDGVSWRYSNTGYKGSFWSGTTLPDGTILVGGLRGTIYRSPDDGKTWRASEAALKSSITDMTAASGKVYAVGLDGVWLESTDGGTTFQAFQREDRLPLTALVANEAGKLVAFSKAGVVPDFGANRK